MLVEWTVLSGVPSGHLPCWPLAFLVAYAWPILQPGLSSSWRHVCTVTDYVIWAVFVAEFITRLVLTGRRGDYAFRHIPDLLMVALPMLRPLRLLRFLVCFA